MSFVSVSPDDLATIVLDGTPLAAAPSSTLHARAQLCGLPQLGDDQQLRLLLGVLLKHAERERAAAAHGGGGGGGGGSSSADIGALPPDAWRDLREEAKGLLLLSLRRDGKLSPNAAAALSMINKPEVVEKYKLLGNRWTITEDKRDAPSAIELARKELGGESSLSTGQWLRSLADALEEPVEERPWYSSKIVLAIVALAAIFVGIHAILLVRVLQKVHIADNRVLIYPIAGLGTAGVVGAFAIGVHKLSGPDTLQQPQKKAKPTNQD